MDLSDLSHRNAFVLYFLISPSLSFFFQNKTKVFHDEKNDSFVFFHLYCSLDAQLKCALYVEELMDLMP